MGPWYSLTAKQSAVAACILDGLTGRQAADAIGISKEAVWRHVEALYRKTGAGKRPQLVEALRKRAREAAAAIPCLPECKGGLCYASPDGFCDAKPRE